MLSTNEANGNSRDVRSRIIDAATELFARGGYAGVSIRDICSRAQVAPPAVYYHVGSKEDLFKAVVVRSITLVSDRLEEVVNGARAPGDRLRDYIEAFMNQSPTWLFRQSLVIPEPGGAHLYESREVQAAVERSRHVLISILDDGQRNGSFRHLDSDRVAVAIHALLHAFLKRGPGAENDDVNRLSGPGPTDVDFVTAFIERALK